MILKRILPVFVCLLIGCACACAAVSDCAELDDSRPDELGSSEKYPVYVIQHNHFDPIWRRGWDRSFDFRGKRYRSYADVQEKIINLWLENAKHGATWSEGQSVVFRKYLERNPDRLQEIRDLVRSGVIELTAAGEVVADTNMPSGETLLRNLIMGQRYFEEEFGVIPTIGWLEDAFGQSAQIPQLFRGIECDSVWRLCYARVPGQHWKGLDGSVIAILDQKDHFVGSFHKIPPCPDCDGMGCMKCDTTGLDPNAALIADHMVEPAFKRDYQHDPYTLIFITGEEVIPNLRLPEFFETARRERGDEIDYRWGTYRQIADNHYADVLARIDDPDVETSDEVEGNPALTGCYVTRIKVKQDFRRVENLVNTAERWATVAHLLGGEYHDVVLKSAWQNVVFVTFHDAITGPHIDQAYFELRDMLADAEWEAQIVIAMATETIASGINYDAEKEYLLILNSDSWTRQNPVTIILPWLQGRPILKDVEGNELSILDIHAQGKDIALTFLSPEVPPLGYSAIEIEFDASPIDSGEIVSGPGEIENEFFRIRTSERGIESITDKRTGGEILDTGRYLANELILEEDIGNPWSTEKIPSFEEGLAKYTTSVNIRRADNVQEILITGQYKGEDENVKVLSWRQSTLLYSGVDSIDFRTKIDWDTAQRRIRIVFPTDIKKDEMVYAIPYGSLTRAKYGGEWRHVPGTNGDWPAVNWVDLYSEQEDRGVALINTGTPSHKVENGVIFMSVLRSPTETWYLNEPHYYDCANLDGARDAGRHEFMYSLVLHQGDHLAAGIEKRGIETNNPLVVRDLRDITAIGERGLRHSFLEIAAPDNIIMTALKKAERDDSVVIRLAETSGMAGEVSLSLENAGGDLSFVNYLERHPQAVSGPIKLNPFRVQTVMLSR